MPENKKLKILGVTPSYWPAFKFGGPVYSTHLLYKTLVKKGVEIDVLTTNAGLDKKKYTSKKWNDIDGVKVKYFGFKGPDNFNLETSHVLPALIRRFHQAKVQHKDYVELWGTGSPKREFLHVDDLADASLFIMNDIKEPDLLNVGTGKDISIKELAEMIKDITDYTGSIKWDSSKPDGTPRKLLDVSKLNDAGWKEKISLKEGIKSTYNWYVEKNC